jgi:hypothetical protein
MVSRRLSTIAGFCRYMQSRKICSITRQETSPAASFDLRFRMALRDERIARLVIEA